MGVASRIGEVAKERNISLKELSRRADIPYTTLYNSVKRDSKMDFETVRRLAAELNIPWYEFYSGEINDENALDLILRRERVKSGDYTERLADAITYLDILQTCAESSSGFVWASDAKNDWMKKNLPMIAEMYNVKPEDIEKSIMWYYEPTEEYAEKIESILYNNPINLEYVERICIALAGLDDDGQRVAVERVEELAQIPKYQRPIEEPTKK